MILRKTKNEPWITVSFCLFYETFQSLNFFQRVWSRGTYFIFCVKICQPRKVSRQAECSSLSRKSFTEVYIVSPSCLCHPQPPTKNFKSKILCLQTKLYTLKFTEGTRKAEVKFAFLPPSWPPSYQTHSCTNSDAQQWVFISEPSLGFGQAKSSYTYNWLPAF